MEEGENVKNLFGRRNFGMAGSVWMNFAMEDTVKPTFVDDSHVDSGKIKYLVMGVVIWLVVYSVKLLKRSPHLNFIVMN